jgi:hypothetical protein
MFSSLQKYNWIFWGFTFNTNAKSKLGGLCTAALIDVAKEKTKQTDFIVNSPNCLIPG